MDLILSSDSLSTEHHWSLEHAAKQRCVRCLTLDKQTPMEPILGDARGHRKAEQISM
jgi:hypothetical protein